MLADQEKTLKLKNEAADKLIKIVSTENEIVQKEKIAGEYFNLVILRSLL